MISFSAIYRPTALFSLKDSNATNAGAKALLLPSPYAIKMAILSRAISYGGVDFCKNGNLFNYIRDTRISYRIDGGYCINNYIVKIRQPKSISNSTVRFREYVYQQKDIEIIFEVNFIEAKEFLQKYLYTINYFGKRGSFFQFIEYRDEPSSPNVLRFDVKNPSRGGILQEYDDFNPSVTFEMVNNYDTKSQKEREKTPFLLPLIQTGASKAYTSYKVKI